MARDKIRVGWADERLKDGRQLVDEVICASKKPTRVHLEQMSDNAYWMVIEIGDERKVFWFGSNAKIRVTHEPGE